MSINHLLGLRMICSRADAAIYSISDKDIKRFQNRIKYTKNCWLWLGSAQRDSGHGVISIRGESCFAHRVAFFLAKGFLPDYSKGRIVMHDCENSSCINPAHLVEGTCKENGNYPECVAKLKSRTGPSASMYGRKGKLSPRFGMKHSKEAREKISKKAAARGGWHKGMKRSTETRRKLSLIFRGENSPKAKLKEAQVVEIFLSPGTQASIARHYKIDPSIVSLIKSKKIWKHVLENI